MDLKPGGRLLSTQHWPAADPRCSRTPIWVLTLNLSPSQRLPFSLRAWCSADAVARGCRISAAVESELCGILGDELDQAAW
jgi:hypothetical protein